MSSAVGLRRAVPLAVFIGTAVLLLWMFGNRLILGTNDEGIYLDAAERILHGQKPYVDFFGYMSPGSFWMQALAFRLFGVTMAAGRVLVILYIALECALIYWLVERFASRATAIVTTLFFLAFQTADPSMLTAQHRWDSSAFALASIALCVARASARWLVASGVLIAWRCIGHALGRVGRDRDVGAGCGKRAGVVPPRDRHSRNGRRRRALAQWNTAGVPRAIGLALAETIRR